MGEKKHVLVPFIHRYVISVQEDQEGRVSVPDEDLQSVALRTRDTGVKPTLTLR